MLDLTVRWQDRASHSLTQHYRNFELCPRHLFGQWFCLERFTGNFLWRQYFTAPNVVFTISDRVILASKIMYDRSWIATIDIYGIYLINGEVILRDGNRGFLGKFICLQPVGREGLLGSR